MGILIVVAVTILASSLWAHRQDISAVLSRLSPFAIPIACLTAIVLLIWMQTVPLPASWVASVSPKAAIAQGSSEWMTISLDVFQTRVLAALSFAYLSVFLASLLLVRTHERLDRLAQVLVFSAVAQVVFGAILFSLKADYRIFYVQVSHERMIGTFKYHNSLAGYLCMCLSIGIGLMLARLGSTSEKHSHWKARVVAAVTFVLSPKMRLRLYLVVIVIGLVLTRSRMGNSAFFASMVIVGLAAVVLARKTAPHTIALIVSLVIVDVLVIGTWVGLEKVVDRIQETEMTIAEGGKSESVEARTEAARMSVPIVKDFPVFGTGGGSFYNIFMGYRSSTYGSVYFDHTHNDYVEIASEYGLVGLGLFGALVASTLFTVLRNMARRRSNLPWGISFGVAMSIVALLIHSTVDFNLQIPSNALTIVVILAMGWIAKELPSETRRRRSSGKL
ncbi:O-antigen ligase family protein [Rhodoferax aquaticus]|nr:O-antigen ligase family protein [Rhodoferax aquaticus]